jgi:hypothetical protein
MRYLIMVVDGVIFQDIERIIERGIKLRIINEKTKPSMAEILYTDLVWRVLNLSHDLDTSAADFEIVHKKMLQYGNLNKILASYEQMKRKNDEKETQEGEFAKIVRKYAAASKKEDEKRKKRFTDISKKISQGEILTEEEQIIYDSGIDAGIETEVEAI